MPAIVPRARPRLKAKSGLMSVPAIFSLPWRKRPVGSANNWSVLNGCGLDDAGLSARSRTRRGPQIISRVRNPGRKACRRGF